MIDDIKYASERFKRRLWLPVMFDRECVCCRDCAAYRYDRAREIRWCFVTGETLYDWDKFVAHSCLLQDLDEVNTEAKE